MSEIGQDALGQLALLYVAAVRLQRRPGTHSLAAIYPSWYVRVMSALIDGTLHESDGRFVLRFERRLAYQVEQVWRAIVEPEENRHWYPARAEFHLQPGGNARFIWPTAGDEEGGAESEVTHGLVQEVDVPRVLAFDEDGHVVRYELTPGPHGESTLVFTHSFTDRADAHRSAAGWQQSLDALTLRLAGDPRAATPTSAPEELVEAYRIAFA
jgi:uncharacterized protein YndB with AHSA1/START domain